MIDLNVILHPTAHPQYNRTSALIANQRNQVAYVSATGTLRNYALASYDVLRIIIISFVTYMFAVIMAPLGTLSVERNKPRERKLDRFLSYVDHIEQRALTKQHELIPLHSCDCSSPRQRLGGCIQHPLGPL